MQRRLSFRKHRKAIAALEFAFTAPFLVAGMAAAVDYGFAQWTRSCLTNALAQGAYYAFLTGTSVTAANIQSVVQNATSLSGMATPTVTGPFCYCPSGNPATLGAVVVGCTPACVALAASPGTYISITASYNFTSFLSSGPASTSQTVVVRLK